MLDLEVSPEEGLQHDHWEFILGMHFSQAVAIVQSQVRVIKYAHVIYNDQNPLSHDLILDLPNDGFRLIFDTKAQRLKLIEIYNLKLLRLKYCGSVFNGSEVIPSVHQIDRCFGPTRPGTFDKERSLFALNFRGLSFYFPVDSQFQPSHSSHSHGLGSLRFPGEATPILSRLVIYQDPQVGGSGCPPAAAPCPLLPSSCFRGNVFSTSCLVLRSPAQTRSLGLKLDLFAQSTDSLLELEGSEPVHFSRSILFGESAQSVTAKLGNPSKIYFKSDDKMKIHSKEAHKKVASDKSDYFFNYFTLGIDILFDATTNVVTKFILHTNFPGHYDFTDYHRCPFGLTLGRTTPLSIIGSSSTTSSTMMMTPSSALLPPLQSHQHQHQHQLMKGQTSSNKFSLDNLNPNPNHPAVIAVEEELLMDKVNLAPPPSNNNPPSTGGGGGGGKNRKKKNNGNNKANKAQPTICSTTSNSTASSSSSSSEKSSPPSEEIPPPMKIMSAGGEGNKNQSCPSSSSVGVDPGATSLEIGWDSRWEEIRNFLWIEKGERGKLEKPVVLTRSSASNPFGPSLCYGVQDLIFEVMSNDHLATVTIYATPQQPGDNHQGTKESNKSPLLDLGA